MSDARAVRLATYVSPLSACVLLVSVRQQPWLTDLVVPD